MFGSIAATTMKKQPKTILTERISEKKIVPKITAKIISINPTTLATLGSEYLNPKTTKKNANSDEIEYPKTASHERFNETGTQSSPTIFDKIICDTNITAQVKILSCKGEYLLDTFFV